MSEPVQNQDTSRDGYRATTTTVGVLLLLYFFFPFFYIYPVFLIYGKRSVPPVWIGRAIEVVFSPVGYLDRHIPAYRAMLEKEARWLGIR